MPPGKLAAQAGHAFVEVLGSTKPWEYDGEHFHYRGRFSQRDAYLAQHPGTKVVLAAPNLSVLQAVYELAREAGLPAVLITDSEHILPPHFDGSPITTALGIGPVTRGEVAPIIKRLRPI